MSPENFCYWLQGYFELSGEEDLSMEQVEVIRDHLKLVFMKLTTVVEIKPTQINTQFWDDIRKQVDKTPQKPFTITC